MHYCNIGILDIGCGNICPIQNMLKLLNVKHKIINSSQDIISCDKLILPGVGSFDSYMSKIKTLKLENSILVHAARHKPILGICVGAQILGKYSEEGKMKGLEILPMYVKKLTVRPYLPVPHMGWNTIEIKNQHDLFLKCETEARFYFAHSYYFVPEQNSVDVVMCNTRYGNHCFASVIEKNNVIAVQFHPEKSQKHGLNVFRNFAFNVN